MDHGVERHVIEFVARQAGTVAERLTLETELNNDIGIAGLDGCDLMTVFQEEFGVDFGEQALMPPAGRITEDIPDLSRLEHAVRTRLVPIVPGAD